MFNLYQSGEITRERIENEQLKTCCLAFWLSYYEDGVYRPISLTSVSNTIEET